MRLTAAVTTPCGAEEWRVRAPGRAELETACCRGAEETWEDGGARQGHGGGSEAQGPRPVTTWVPGGPRHLRAGQREGRDMEGGDRGQHLCAGWAGDRHWENLRVLERG